MKVFITGATGFVGSHLAEFLSGQGFEVWGVTRSEVLQANHNGKWNLLRLDLSDEESLIKTLDQLQPDMIFHLAGQSSVKASWDNKAETFEANVMLTIHLLEAVRKSKAKDATVITVGSSEEYGQVRPEEMPITEETPLRPLSPYGVSKASIYLLARQYHQANGLRVIHVRPFNHIGPGQRPGFVTSDFAKQVSEIEAGIRPPVLGVGNLTAERDFLDVRDIVRAYHLIALRGKAGEVYNVCSSKPVKIRSILDFFIANSTVKIEIRQNEKLFRPVDFPRYIGSNKKLTSQLAWHPTVTLEESLLAILSYWRSAVKSR